MCGTPKCLDFSMGVTIILVLAWGTRYGRLSTGGGPLSHLTVGKILMFFGRGSGKGQNIMAVSAPTQCFTAVRPHGSSTSYTQKNVSCSKTAEQRNKNTDSKTDRTPPRGCTNQTDRTYETKEVCDGPDL